MIKTRNRLLADKVIKGLESRNMCGYYAETKEDALQKALELIPEGSSIGWGGSVSVSEIGLRDAILNGNYTVYNRDNCSTEEALSRIKSQMSQENKVKYADYIIDNSGTIDELRKKALIFLNYIKENWSE